MSEGDEAGLALVRALIERAEQLPPSGRARLLARAAELAERYASRPAPELAAPAPVEDDWSARLAAQRPERAPDRPRSERPPSAAIVAEIRSTAATERAADVVPEVAGPYHGAAVAARALEELAAIAPGYVGDCVAWLEDLACLTELPERRAQRAPVKLTASVRRAARSPRRGAGRAARS